MSYTKEDKIHIRNNADSYRDGGRLANAVFDRPQRRREKSLSSSLLEDIQEMRRAFERGVCYAASVRRHAQAPFPLQFSDPPGMISRAIQTVRVPAPPIAPIYAHDGSRIGNFPEDQFPG
jgi:hypothetical protein